MSSSDAGSRLLLLKQKLLKNKEESRPESASGSVAASPAPAEQRSNPIAAFPGPATSIGRAVTNPFASFGAAQSAGPSQASFGGQGLFGNQGSVGNSGQPFASPYQGPASNQGPTNYQGPNNDSAFVTMHQPQGNQFSQGHQFAPGRSPFQGPTSALGGMPPADQMVLPPERTIPAGSQGPSAIAQGPSALAQGSSESGSAFAPLFGAGPTPVPAPVPPSGTRSRLKDAPAVKAAMMLAKKAADSQDSTGSPRSNDKPDMQAAQSNDKAQAESSTSQSITTSQGPSSSSGKSLASLFGIVPSKESQPSLKPSGQDMTRPGFLETAGTSSGQPVFKQLVPGFALLDKGARVSETPVTFKSLTAKKRALDRSSTDNSETESLPRDDADKDAMEDEDQGTLKPKATSPRRSTQRERSSFSETSNSKVLTENELLNALAALNIFVLPSDHRPMKSIKDFIETEEKAIGEFQETIFQRYHVRIQYP